MRLNTYLSFDGNCEEAINFYKDILDAEVTVMTRFEEAPPEVMKISESDKKLIMHCTLHANGNVLMMSDHLNPEFVRGNTYSLSVNTDEESAYSIFNSLLVGGQTIMPFNEAFWGGKFGMLVDKFGVQWMVTSEHKPS